MHCKEAYRGEKMKNNNYKTTSEENFIKNTKKRKVGSSQKKKMTPVAKGFAIAGITLGSIIGVLVAVILGLVIYFFTKPMLMDNDRAANEEYVDSQGNTNQREQNEDKNTKKYYTFLATATDKAGNLTDVIMVANLTFDEKNPKVSILQIPRDTYIKISSSKLHFNADGELSEANFSGSTAGTAIKINEAYYRGKNLAYDTITELLEAVDGKNAAEVTAICSEYKYKFLHVDVNKVKKYAKSDKEEKKELEADIRRDFGIFYLEQLIFYNFRIPIDYYAQVNIKGFRGIVDAIGGVDLNVPRRMYYKDEYQDLYIDLYPGYQHLDGNKAEQFVRFRSYVGGDVDRLDAQKIFMDAFLDKLISVGVTKIDPIMDIVEENLYTSVTFDGLVTLARLVINMDLSTDVKMHTLPGAGQYVNGISYYLVDKQASCELINSEFNVYTSKILVDDMLVTDHGNIYVPVSNTNPNLEYVPEEDSSENDNTDKNDVAEESGENNEADVTDESGENNESGVTDESGENSEGNVTDESGENSEGDVTDESGENNEGDVTDESGENSEGGVTDESGENNEGGVTDESGENSEGDVTDESGENSEGDVTDESGENSEGDVADDANDITQEPDEETDIPASETEDNTSTEETASPDETESESETVENSEDSIENDDNYALLEEITNAA